MSKENKLYHISEKTASAPGRLYNKGQRRKIQIGDVIFGGDELAMIAGPCAVETEAQLMEAAIFLKKLGINIMRSSLFKPRTSPYSFQGLGLAGLDILKNVKQETGILLESEIVDIRNVEILAEYVDMLRIGTRNMQNFELLKEVGKINKPIILKRGFSSTIYEFIHSAEYILMGGNKNVILCERGIRTFETAYRNTLDLAAIEILKKETDLPVIVDPSHAAGDRSLVPALSKAAVAAGADGLIIEMHPDPEKALSDGPQSLYPSQMEKLHREILAIKKTMSDF